MHPRLRGDAAIASLLLDKLAPVDTRDSGGRTPLLVACASEQRWPVALQLLKRKADASDSLAAIMRSVGSTPVFPYATATNYYQPGLPMAYMGFLCIHVCS